MRYRHDTFHADRVIYVVDSRQQMHFRQVFAAAQRWGYGRMQLEHVGFGTILGADKKPIKTREGGDVKLRALLTEAEERAGPNRRGEASRAERARARRPGAGSGTGCAEVRRSRAKPEPRLRLQLGEACWPSTETPPLICKTPYVRIRAIFRKAGLAEAPRAEVKLKDEAELALARKLLDFADSVYLAAEECRPHYICLYLFELATLFHRFYELCPVLTSADDISKSRLLLCDLTGKTLRQGLQLLGIDVAEQM